MTAVRHMSKIIYFIAFLFLTAVFFAGANVNTSAFTVPAQIRVGLETNHYETDSIIISNSDILIGYERNGQFLSQASLSGVDSYAARPLNTHCIRFPSVYDTLGQARLAASIMSDANTACVPAITANGSWRVFGINYETENAARLAADDYGCEYVSISGKRIAFYANTSAVLIWDRPDDYPQIRNNESGQIKLGSREYRGIIEIGRYSGLKLTAVNVINLEDYLLSVVPSEMPSGWSDEALKAQAVASRSYAITRSEAYNGKPYDLCDRTHCQLYVGATRENEAAAAAVFATRGQLAMYGGLPINACYFASSGGHTDNSENVWFAAEPYLRAVFDPYEFEPSKWTRAFTLDEITDLLRRDNVRIGAATGITTVSDVSGRVQSMTVTGTSGSHTYSKEAIRSFFSASSGGELMSRNFELTNGRLDTEPTYVFVYDGVQTVRKELNGLAAVSSANVSFVASAVRVRGNITASTLSVSTQVIKSDGDEIILQGSGWGHGVGMSQRGAEGLARRGYDYISILKYYYTGITVE